MDPFPATIDFGTPGLRFLLKLADPLGREFDARMRAAVARADFNSLVGLEALRRAQRALISRTILAMRPNLREFIVLGLETFRDHGALAFTIAHHTFPRLPGGCSLDEVPMVLLEQCLVCEGDIESSALFVRDRFYCGTPNKTMPIRVHDVEDCRKGLYSSKLLEHRNALARLLDKGCAIGGDSDQALKAVRHLCDGFSHGIPPESALRVGWQKEPLEQAPAPVKWREFL